jgi:hypothetical protein
MSDELSHLKTAELERLRAHCRETEVIGAADQFPRLPSRLAELVAAEDPFRALQALEAEEPELARRMFLAALSVFVNTRSAIRLDAELGERATRN